jgi:4a-hydroxytetrahydrobiopterin dehydratase
MDTPLAKKKCVVCEKKGMPALDRAHSEAFLTQIPGWMLSDDAKKISREFTFKDFIGSMDFINAVADIAEAEGHHPDIYIFYNKVRLDLYTHAVDGLSENDFIVAAKINEITKFH